MRSHSTTRNIQISRGSGAAFRRQAFPVSRDILYRRLKDAGVIVNSEDKKTGRLVTLEGVRRRVLHVPVATLFPKPEPGDADPAAVGD